MIPLGTPGGVDQALFVARELFPPRKDALPAKAQVDKLAVRPFSSLLHAFLLVGNYLRSLKKHDNTGNR
jgi:hypothetical protein